MRPCLLLWSVLLATGAGAAEEEAPAVDGLYLEDAPSAKGKPAMYQVARRAGGRYWVLAGTSDSVTHLYAAEARRDRGGRVQLVPGGARPATLPAVAIYPSPEGKRDLVETDAAGRRSSFSRLVDARIARALGELRGGRKLRLFPPDKRQQQEPSAALPERAAGDSVTVEDTFVVTARLTDKGRQRCWRGALVPMPAELAQRMARGLPATRRPFALPFMLVGVRGGPGCDGPLLDGDRPNRLDDLQFGATLFLDAEGAVIGVHLFADALSAAYLVEGRPADELARQVQTVSDEEMAPRAE